MGKKLLVLIVIFFLILLYIFSQEPENISQSKEKGKLFIYFRGEEAGYEEYEWSEQPDKFILSVKGEMTKPMSLSVSEMVIEVDKEFKPLRFYLKGAVAGVGQEIDTTVTQDKVKNILKAAQQKRESTSTISPDALFLPNGIFSSYVVLAKKIRGLIKEKIILPAYIVPQLEVKLSVEPDRENARLFHLNLAGVKIELDTDEQGNIKSLAIPSQSLEVYEQKFKKEKPSEKVERTR